MSSRQRQLQDLKASLPQPPDDGLPMVVIFPDLWPVPAQGDYQNALAVGDVERAYQIVEQQTGNRVSRRPGDDTRVIPIYQRPDGPQ